MMLAAIGREFSRQLSEYKQFKVNLLFANLGIFFLVTGFKADCLACSVDLIAEIIDSAFLFLVDGSEVEFNFLDGHVLSFRLKVPDLANIDVF